MRPVGPLVSSAVVSHVCSDGQNAACHQRLPIDQAQGPFPLLCSRYNPPGISLHRYHCNVNVRIHHLPSMRPFPISPIIWLIIMANTWRTSAVPHRLTIALFMQYFMWLLVFSKGRNMSHSLALHFLVCEMSPRAGEEQGWDPDSLCSTAELASYGYCLIEIVLIQILVQCLIRLVLECRYLLSF